MLVLSNRPGRVIIINDEGILVMNGQVATIIEKGGVAVGYVEFIRHVLPAKSSGVRKRKQALRASRKKYRFSVNFTTQG